MATKSSLYEGGIRVPMIARWPGKIAPGMTNDVPTAHWDLFPTLVHVAGAHSVKTGGWPLTAELLSTGRSKLSKRPYLFWQTSGTCTVRSGDWKVIRNDRYLPWEL